MRPVAAAVRAVLHQLEPVRVVAPVLPGDVVAVLALLAGQGDLGPHVGGSHSGVPFSLKRACRSGPSNLQPPANPASSRPTALAIPPATTCRGFRGLPPGKILLGRGTAARAA